MNWQATLTFLAIAFAAGYVFLRCLRVLRPARGGCAGGCGCSKTSKPAAAPTTLIAPESLQFRQSNPLSH